MFKRLFLIGTLCCLPGLSGCGMAAFYCLEKYSEHHKVPFGCDW